MAKLKPIDFKFAAVAGEPLVFRSEVTVSDTNGEFALTIPDVLEEVSNQVLQSHGKVYGVTVSRPRTNLRVDGAVLDSCKRFIEHVAKDFLRCDVTEELVIVYGVINQSLEAVGPLKVDQVEAGLAALIGFYFGARS